MKKVILTVAAVAVAYVAALAFIAFQPQERDGEEALPVVPAGPPLPGSPQMNTTDIWIVIIGEVDQEHTLDHYQSTLMHDGKILVGPETLHPMLLGRNEDLKFWFHEGTPNGGCGPISEPCNGMLSEGDYLKLDGVIPGETYMVQVLWKATGEVLVEVEVNT
jgi:hypothetical protein